MKNSPSPIDRMERLVSSRLELDPPLNEYVPLRELASELQLLKARAFALGLYPTGHALDRATLLIGYDIARVISGDRIPKNVLRDAGAYL